MANNNGTNYNNFNNSNNLNNSTNLNNSNNLNNFNNFNNFNNSNNSNNENIFSSGNNFTSGNNFNNMDSSQIFYYYANYLNNNTNLLRNIINIIENNNSNLFYLAYNNLNQINLNQTNLNQQEPTIANSLNSSYSSPNLNDDFTSSYYNEFMESNQDTENNEFMESNQDIEPNEFMDLNQYAGTNQDVEPNPDPDSNQNIENNQDFEENVDLQFNNDYDLSSNILNVEFQNLITTILREARERQNIAIYNYILENCLREIRFGDIENPLNTECPILQTEFSEEDNVIQIIECSHIFNSDSLKDWLFRNNHTCPICRFNLISNSEFIRNRRYSFIF